MDTAKGVVALILLIYPILLMIPENPKSFEIIWLGHGPLIIGISILIPLLLLNEKILTINPFSIALALGFTLATYLIFKLGIIGNLTIFEGELWRIRGWISSFDIMLYSIYLIFLSIIIKFRKIIIVSIYLLITAILYIFDLLNPYYIGPFYNFILFVGHTSEMIGNVMLPASYKLKSFDEIISLIAEYKNNYSSVIIGWPCTGITSIFLYIVFYTVIREKISKLDIIPFILGIMIINILNSFRISLILFLNLTYGLKVGELFHSLIYEVISIIIIIGYIYIVDKILGKYSKKLRVMLT